jgi:hypothetical protein
MAFSRAVGRVLRRAVADHDWQVAPPGIGHVLEASEQKELPEAAAFHGVPGCVYHSLRGNQLLDADVSGALRATYHRAVLTHRQVLADLRDIAPALDSVGAPWLVVKGPVLSETIYPRPDLRGYTDLDLVVPATHLGRFLNAVEEGGGRVADYDWTLVHQLMLGELQLVLRGGTLVDLHWHLLNQASLRQVFAIPMERLFERARTVSLPGGPVATLDPVDTLVYLGLHGCLSGGNRLVWLKDVEQAIASDNPPWDEVIRRSRDFGASLTLASMLIMARAVLGTPVPNEVLGDLARSTTWPLLIAATRQLSPIERATDSRSVLRLISQGTRRDVRSSTMELSRRVALALPDAVRRSTNRLPVPQPPSGGVGKRTVFLDAVARAATQANGRCH